jgi:hypothetical protein
MMGRKEVAMSRFAAIILLCAVIAAASGFAPPETYTIEIKDHPAKGIPVRVVEKSTAVSHFLGTDRDGKVAVAGHIPQNQKSERASELSYTDTITEINGGRPKTFQRAYGKACDTEGKKTRDRPYSGRTIIFRLNDGRYKVTAEGDAPLTKETLGELAQLVRSYGHTGERLLLPGKAVKEGDTWKISGKAVATYLGDEWDASGSKGTGKLVRAYKKDGKVYGVLQFDYESATKPQEKAWSVKLKVSRTVDTPIDGSSTDARETIKLTLIQSRKLAFEGKQVHLERRVEFTAKEVRIEGKPRKAAR